MELRPGLPYYAKNVRIAVFGVMYPFAHIVQASRILVEKRTLRTMRRSSVAYMFVSYVRFVRNGRTKPHRSHRVLLCPICRAYAISRSKSGHIRTHHLISGLSALLPRTCPIRTFLSKAVIQPICVPTMEFSTNHCIWVKGPSAYVPYKSSFLVNLDICLARPRWPLLLPSALSLRGGTQPGIPDIWCYVVL